MSFSTWCDASCRSSAVGFVLAKGIDVARAALLTAVFAGNALFAGNVVAAPESRTGLSHPTTANDSLPTATDDAYSTDEDTPLVLGSPGVLANDTAWGSDSLTASLATGPSFGSLLLESDGSFVYTPHVNFYGIDSFTYSAVAPGGASDLAQVSIVVNPVNDAPVVLEHTYDLGEARSLTIVAPGVLQGASDADYDRLTIFLETSTTHGSLSLAEDGSFVYEPDPDYTGMDSFTYRVEDGRGGVTTGTVKLTVNWLPVVFSVMGDAPYGEDEIPEFLQVMSDHNLYSPAEFMVHVGDILQDEPCAEERYILIAETMKASRVPAFIIPGDNETKDCADPAQGWQFWMRHLLFLETNFCPFTQVEHQSERIENFAFVHNGLLVMGIDLLGGSNPEPLLQDDANWVVQQLQQHGDRVRGAVILAQAMAENSIFTDPFEAAASAFGKPVLYIHGDGHEWIYDYPFSSPNILRVQVDRGNEPPVHVTATLSNEEMFVFDRDPFRDATPVTSAPCGLTPMFANDVSVTEGNAGIRSIALTVGVSEPHDSTITIDYATSGGSATVWEDYIPTSGTLVFPPNVWEQTINLAVRGDTLYEQDETILVEFSNATNAWMRNRQAKLTIRNDDPRYFNLSATPLGPGSVSVSPPSSRYLEGSWVTLNAIPQPGLSFVGWSGDLSGFTNPMTIRMDSSMVVFANFDYNEAPMAYDDAFQAMEDLTLSVAPPGVVDNDTDPDGDPVTVKLLDPPAHGEISLDANGGFSYRPAPDFFGTDLFKYELLDGRGGVDVGSVSIIVENISDVPVAVDDSYRLEQGAVLFPSSPGVLGNDLDVDGMGLTPILVSGPEHGSLTLNFDGSFSYYAADFVGTDHFVYRASNGVFESGNATVSLEVTLVNADTTLHLPVADAYVRSTDPQENFGAEDYLRIETDSRIYNTYLKFQVSGIGQVQSARLRLFVTDDGPNAGSITLVSNNYRGTSTAWTENGIHWDNAPVISGPVLDSVAPAPQDEWVEFEVADAFNGDGVYSFAVRNPTTRKVDFSSKEGVHPPQLVIVSGDRVEPSTVPIAVDDVYTVAEDESLSVAAAGVLANDVDAGGDSLFAVLMDPPVHGVLNLRSDGSLTYVPAADWSGEDSFTYKASDRDSFDLGRVTITVQQVNDPPVAQGETHQTDEDTPLTVTAPGVLGNDSDVDSGRLNAALVSAPVHGSLRLGADGSFIYTPSAEWSGTDVFAYEANDGSGGADTAMVTIVVQAVNDPPTLLDDAYSVDEDDSLHVALPGVLMNDYDVEGDSLRIFLHSTTSHGTLGFAGGGFDYVPNADFFGVDTFVYRVEDGQGGVSLASAVLTVRGRNDFPVAVPDNAITAEDQVLSVAAPGVLANDQDVDADSLHAAVVGSVVNGQLTLNADGSYIYTPSQDFHGSDIFSYVVDDGHGGIDTTVVTILVSPVNDAPMAILDHYVLLEDDSLAVSTPGVLSNDSDVEGDSLTVAAQSPPTHGILQLASDGSFQYRPNPDFFGIDSFTYRVVDARGATSIGTATLEVTGTQDVPIAADDAYGTDEDVPLIVNIPGVLLNDTDVDQESLFVTLLQAPANGFLALHAEGSFEYTPHAEFNGLDQFVYVVNDSEAATDTARVQLTINPINDPPRVSEDSYPVVRGTSLSRGAPGVLGNDRDVEGQDLTAILVQPPAHGAIALNTDGSFSYTPALDFNGIDHFVYRASDGVLQSEEVTVSLFVMLTNPIVDQVGPIADARIKSSDPTDNSGFSDALRVENDTDRQYRSYLKFDLTDHTFVSRATLRLYVIDDGPDGGKIYPVSNDFLGTTTAWTEEEINWNNAPLLGAAALDSLGTVVQDTWVEADLTSGITGGSVYSFGIANESHRRVEYSSREGVQPPELLVESVNLQPGAIEDVYNSFEDEILQVPPPGVLSNDFDVDGSSLRATLVSGPQHGTVELRLDGSFDYVPHPNWSGSDSLAYRVEDDRGGSGSAWVRLEVGAVEDLPISADDTYGTNEDEALFVDSPGILSNDIDADGDSLTVAVLDSTQHGALTWGADGSFSYAPESDFAGIDGFSYIVRDSAGGVDSSMVFIHVSPVNDPPVAQADSHQTQEDLTLDLGFPGVLANDFDVDGDSLFVSLAVAPIHGTVTLHPDGSFQYTPHPDYVGPDSLVYYLLDGVSSDTCAVQIMVAPVNDAPRLGQDFYEVTEDDTLVVAAPGVLHNDIDVEGDSLFAVVDSLPAHGQLTFTGDGSFVYIPAPNYAGADAFFYRVQDSHGAVATTRASVTVLGVNDPPVAIADSFSTDEDSLLSILAPGVLLNDIDVDGDTLSVVALTTVAHGTLSLEPNGSCTYLPEPDFYGEDSFTYLVFDGRDRVASTTVRITVRPINDAPIVVDESYGMQEDDSLTVAAPGVLQNDSDIEADTLRAGMVTPPSHGRIVFSADGSFRYVPEQDFFGVDLFTYRVVDGHGGATTGTATFQVSGVNDVPVATDDVYKGMEDQRLVVQSPGILANDLDVDGDTLRVLVASAPVHGVLHLQPDGAFHYAPNQDFSGTDAFTYALRDGHGGLDSARVSIEVRPVNDRPKVVHEFYSVNEDIVVAMPGVLQNDSDSDEDPLSAFIERMPTHGELKFKADGSFKYRPDSGYVGEDSFEYRVEDGNGGSARGTAKFQVEKVRASSTVVEPQELMTFKCVADAFVLACVPAQNFGQNAVLQVGEEDAAANSYIAFAVKGVTQVERAVLRLYALEGGSDGGMLFGIVGRERDRTCSWSEGELSWRNAPPLSGRVVSTVGAVRARTWVEIDVTRMIQGEGHYSFGISSLSPQGIRYSSKEGLHAPELVLHCVRDSVLQVEPQAPLSKQNPGLSSLVPLYRVYPNPFSQRTVLEYESSAAARVSAIIYDPRGRRVRELLNTVQPPGRNRLFWDGSDDRGRPMGSGAYFLKLRIGGQLRVQKILLRR